MLVFKGLTLRNFISTGAVTQSLDMSINGLTLILGHGIDANGDVTRNGAGKSTILQAICYALFGKALTRIKADNMINDINGKNMLVTIEFEIGNDQYRIERGRKPAVLRFFRNEVEIKRDDAKDNASDSRGENGDTQEDINSVLGMDHTMFCHTVALNTLTTPFLKAGAADQRDVIEKLLGVTQLSERAKVLGKKISTTKDDIKTHEATVTAVIDSNRRIKEAADQARAKAIRWKADHDASLAEILSLLTALEGIDIDAEIAAIDSLQSYDANKREAEAAVQQLKRELDILDREARAIQTELIRMKRDAETLDPDNLLSKLDRDERAFVNAKSDIEFKLQMKNKTKASLETELAKRIEERDGANGSECSTCGQALHGTDHLAKIEAKLAKVVAEVQSELEIVTGEIVALEAQIASNANDLAAAREAIVTATSKLEASKAERMADYEAQRAKQVSGTDEAEAIAKKIADAQSVLNQLGVRPSPRYKTAAEVYQIKQDRDALEKEVLRLSDEANPHEDQVAAFEAAVAPVDYEPLETAKDLLRHQELLQRLLTNKDSVIRKKIIEQNLHNLNTRMDHYLEKLVSPFQVKFNSDLSVDITKLGRDYDIDQLSKGEMNRVIMATSWAFRDLWESLNFSHNLMFVDELLDNGTDSSGAEAALQILKAMARDRGKNVFLISHKEELRGRIDRTLLVSKEEGFSRFDLEEYG